MHGIWYFFPFLGRKHFSIKNYIDLFSEYDPIINENIKLWFSEDEIKCVWHFLGILYENDTFDESSFNNDNVGWFRDEYQNVKNMFWNL